MVGSAAQEELGTGRYLVRFPPRAECRSLPIKNNETVRFEGSFGDHFGDIRGSFGGRLGVIWETFGGHVGIILESFWNHFGIVLESFWDQFGIILG